MLVLKRKLLYCCGLICLLLLISPQTFSQTFTVKGKVLKLDDNTPLADVSVVELGSNKGTKTDATGAYTLKVSKNKAVLAFTSVDFERATAVWDGKTAVDIKLVSKVSTLEDVVVVGYGTQKKINQTGATQTVKFDDAVNAPVTNAAQLMYGKFSGVQLTQSSGLPGSDNSSIVIRGVGTFGSTDPLVVIDNIQYTGLDAFNNLAPSDIETVSVLKDASASAIYGSRGANGVIVVTTKKGKSGANNGSIIYNSYLGTQRVTTVPQYLNAVDYANLRNERDINLKGPNAVLRFTPANIQAIIDGSDPNHFANTKWSDEILKEAPIQNQYLSFSGGNDKTTYRVSLGYLTQGAIVRGKFKTRRFTLSSNIDSKVNNWLSISNVLNTYWNTTSGPSGGAGVIGGETGIINQFQRSSPVVPAYYLDGNYGYVDGVYLSANPSFPIDNALKKGQFGDNKNDNINISNRFGLKITINKNLSLETSGSLIYNSGLVTNFNPSNTIFDANGNIVVSTFYNTLSNSSNFNYRLLNENIIRYIKKIKKHDITFLLGHSVTYSKNSLYSASLSGFPSDALQQLSAGGSTQPLNSGSANEDALQSFFSRINYTYNGKYLFEANIRRDGSSRFGPDNLYGNFPSASAGWRISQEKFIRKISWISDLKLRASWGITGNDNLNPYVYAQSYNAGLTYIVGGATTTGVAITQLANPRVRWESVQQTDIGIDASFFRNSLSFTADYFIRNSSDLLYKNIPVPSSIGVTNLQAENAANLVNKGIELSANYRGRVKKINYTIGASASIFADNKVTALGDRGLETIAGQTIIRIGVPFNAYYGYQAVGIFQTAGDVAKAAKQFGSILTAPGDIQYADLSGPNGTPDGIIDAYDKTVIGTPHPKLLYHFNGTVNYKSFDLSVAFQGVNGVNRLLNSNGQLPMADERNNVLSYYINRWTPANPSTTLPRLGGVNNGAISSFYIQDASYLRMKNVEIGYTLPVSLTKKFLMQKFRIYASGQNLLTFTKMQNFDPERASTSQSDLSTPLYKVYTIGLNIKFL